MKNGIFILMIWFLCFGCKEESVDERPNILLIVSEDNSSDLGCYGNDIVHTPNLDRLAQEGVRFTNAYTTYSVCSPSRSSIFTGLYPHQNGQLGWATHFYGLFDNIKVLPQYLEDTDYKTGIIGKIHVNPESKFNFDFTAIPESNFGKENLSEYASKANAFVKTVSKDSPYLLMVNFPDAHLPFQDVVEGLPTIQVDSQVIDATLPFVGVNTERLRSVTRQYYNCMNRLDESIGMLLDSLGDLSNTCIIYLSDHGAQFSRGKLTNYEGGLKIPLICNWPGKIEGRNEVRTELVSVVDLLPTILDISGKAVPDFLPGRSLLDLFNMKGADSPWRTYLGADGEGASPVFYYPRRSIRNERYKLIQNIDVGRGDFPAYHAYANPEFASGATEEEIESSAEYIRNTYATWKNPPEYELYDLQEDPWEFNNLAQNSQFIPVLEEMKKVMLNWRQKTDDPLLDADKLNRFSKEMDSINDLYPDHTYRSVDNFSWKYFDYLNQ